MNIAEVRGILAPIEELWFPIVIMEFKGRMCRMRIDSIQPYIFF